MEISFLKIKQNPLEIDYSKDSTSIVGTLERVNRDSVKLISTFKTSVEVICNRCGKEYMVDANYPLELLLSEGRYNSNEEIDVVEFFEGKIDLKYLADSEIASIEEGYNFCESCIDNEEILEIEF
jgi:uncharacterized metal-binding protein YceD (DUF177 family)